MTARRILFHVNHLWGQGHFVRVHAIAREVAAHGSHATIMNGGAAVLREGGLRLAVIQMPAISSKDDRYTELVDEDGARLGDDFRAMRKELALSILESQRPDLLVTETFPFGRRKLQFELDPLVAAAQTMGIPVFSSVRDIVTCPDDKRVDEAHARLANRFAGVLVHGDPRITTLKDSWPRAGEIAPAVIDTGYVTDGSIGPPPAAESRRGIIVSAGAGASGEAVLRAAADARIAGVRADVPWLFVTGPRARPGLETDLAAKLARADGHSVTILRELNPLGPAIHKALLSIGRGGYNTVIEAVAAGTRMAIVPHVRPGEDEQSVRAQAFADRGLVALADHVAIESGDRQAACDAMIAAIMRAFAMAPPDASRVNANGAAASARLLVAAAGGTA